ncbi:MAG: tRNA (adenosine(37)-N6)-threonylcarbamoyltransferase complex ATPase subunit type 1 TsaE [Clostridiales bacterium]|nr:tRNA (adenosine(37)-N6)-threonylcarbamoyltransferase complex ATPase subunit type 1 TsaE [Clostridiales bacterium]
MNKTYITKSPEETEKLGEKLAKSAKAGDIFCLSGDLGTGKTAFAKGFAKGLEITEHITSPTFTIINEYSGRLKLYHFDVYRLEDEEELYGIGADEYFYGEGVCLIEWAELVKEAIPESAVWINIEKDLEKGENYRKIEVRL